MNQAKPDPIFRRLLSLVFAPAYLVILSMMLSAPADVPWLFGLFWVLAGSLVIMVVLVVFGVRALEYRESKWRFGIGTLMLVTVPLGIYLAACRFVVVSESLDSYESILVPVLGLPSFLVTMVVLLLWADSLMWIAVVVLRMLRWAGRTRHETVV